MDENSLKYCLNCEERICGFNPVTKKFPFEDREDFISKLLNFIFTFLCRLHHWQIDMREKKKVAAEIEFVKNHFDEIVAILLVNSKRLK